MQHVVFTGGQIHDDTAAALGVGDGATQPVGRIDVSIRIFSNDQHAVHARFEKGDHDAVMPYGENLVFDGIGATNRFRRLVQR